MNDVFLCHAPADANTANEIGQWLELNTPCRARLSECGAGCADDLVEAADQAMSGVAVVLLLSPASVPEKWDRSRWEPVLIEQPLEAGIGLACVVVKECRFPELLHRRDCFANDLAGRRALKRWLLARFPRVKSLPAGLGAGGPAAIEDLRLRLADVPGTAVDVPRDVALAFARACAADFEGAIWLDGTRRTAAGIAGDLAAALGLTLEGPVEECQERLRSFCAGRRLLVVLDNCGTLAPAIDGRSSVLRTQPNEGPSTGTLDELAAIFAGWAEFPEPCLEALRDVAAVVESRPWSDVREIAYAAVSLLQHRLRAAELHELAGLLIPHAGAAGDATALRRFEWERSWILQAWERPGPVASPVLPPPAGDQLVLPFPIV